MNVSFQKSMMRPHVAEDSMLSLVKMAGIDLRFGLEGTPKIVTTNAYFQCLLVVLIIEPR